MKLIGLFLLMFFLYNMLPQAILPVGMVLIPLFFISKLFTPFKKKKNWY